MITLFFLIICHSHRCFQNYIYIPQKNFTNMFLILLLIRVFQKFYHNYHGDCRILANGMQIQHLECHYCLPLILGRRTWPYYPRHSLRMCLHHLLLDTHQPYTMSIIWGCFIWTFCHCIKCSIYPAVITSRWALQEWFQHCWPANTFVENPLHTPCVQHGTCILQSGAHYTLQHSYHNEP